MAVMLKKPRIIPEIERDDYLVVVRLRYRRSWRKMTDNDRAEALGAMATQLRDYAEQMDAELQELQVAA